MAQDPGWRGTWRYGLSGNRRRASAPSRLQLRRGVVVDGLVFFPVVAIAAALHVAIAGRLRFLSPGSGPLFFLAPILFGLCGWGIVEFSRVRGSAADRLLAAGAQRAVAGVAAVIAGVTVAELAGWWPAALIGGALCAAGIVAGAPTRARIERAAVGAGVPVDAVLDELARPIGDAESR